MSIKLEIQEILKAAQRELTVSEIIARGKFPSQPYVSRALAELKEAGKVASRKDGRQVFYRPLNFTLGLEENLNLKGLKEDEVFEALRANQLFVDQLNDRLVSMLYFAFSEMLNNAVDHSRSNIGYAKIWLEDGVLKFIVSDKGIGVFQNFMAQKHLPTEVDAIRELIKGKQTTAPKRHSGEGIFWTSKLADRFTLSSYGYQLTVDGLADDYAIKELQGDERVYGTEVYFELALDTPKSLHKLFEHYSLERERYSFTTTEIPIKLYEDGDVWISRSQAKKILAGLERYKKIIFDFKGIDMIGQGFSDEIFRVFREAHPEIVLDPINMNPTVEMMVRRALNE